MILFIEDRKQRLIDFLSSQNFTLQDFGAIHNIKVLEAHEIQLVEQDINHLNSWGPTLIICHGSWLKDKNLYDSMMEIAAQKAGRLVLFSGGIVDVDYYKTDVELLYVPVSKLYSSYLIDFVKNYTKDIELLELPYGDFFRLNEMLKKRKKLWLEQKEVQTSLNQEIKNYLYGK